MQHRFQTVAFQRMDLLAGKLGRIFRASPVDARGHQIGQLPGLGLDLAAARRGAAAGMWIYDQFSGNHSPDRGNDNFDDNESHRRDSDYASSGDSFSDDSSSGDSGGGDSGGGDSGGGDF